MKGFAQAFSKACEVEGEKPSSPFANGEIFFGISLLKTFLFVPVVSKRKVAKEFAQCNALDTFRLQNPAASTHC